MEKKIKKAAESIHMPQDMKIRIARNCSQKKEKRFLYINKRLASMAAVLLLCITLPLGVGAAGKLGIMRDIKNWQGAVTGQVYEKASDTISVSAVVKDHALLVTAVLEYPQEIPFVFIEALDIGEYEIRDSSGKRISRGYDTDSAQLLDGNAVISIPIDSLPSGTYALKIKSFTAHAKAEQPLKLMGSWECSFQRNS